MSETPLIEINGLWKSFNRSTAGAKRSLTGQLWRAFWGASQREVEPQGETFWALRGINAKVRRGQALGVIGHNGAGKTTLLRTLMGEHQADRGEVVMRGKACGLIDLLAGFNQTLTGRENIYVRGGYLGFSDRELAAIEQEIIDFADIGEFIDAPMQNYSQGMRMRLGFAVTTAVQADIMIIDEILAVGDFLFHNKCMAKMNELRAQRATVLVSHGMETIVQFADEVIVLDRGGVAFHGDPIEAVETYRRLEMTKARGERPALETDAVRPARRPRLRAPATTAKIELPNAEAADAPNQVAAEPALFRESELPVELAEGAIDPATLPAVLRTVMGEFIYNQARIDEVSQRWSELPEGGARLRIEFTAVRDISRLVVGVPMWTSAGTMVTGFGTQGQRIRNDLIAGDRHRIELTIPKLRINRGVYYPVVAIMDGTEYLYRWPIEAMNVLENSAPMVWGLMTTHYEWLQSTPMDECGGND